VPALLIVLLPVNCKVEPLCTRNIQSALDSKWTETLHTTIDECSTLY